MTTSSSTYPMTSHFTRTGMGSGLEDASISLPLVSGDPHPVTLSGKSHNPYTTLPAFVSLCLLPPSQTMMGPWDSVRRLWAELGPGISCG